MELHSRSPIRFTLEFSLLGHDAASLVFRNLEECSVITFKSQGVPKERLLTFADEDNMILLTVGYHSPKNPVSHPRRHEPPPQEMQLWEPQVSEIYFTLLYCVYGHRFIPYELQSSGCYYFRANHEQTDLTGSCSGRSVGHDLHLYAVPSSCLGRDNGCPDWCLRGFCQSLHAKAEGNTITDYKPLLSNYFQFNGIHILVLIVKNSRKYQQMYYIKI